MRIPVRVLLVEESGDDALVLLQLLAEGGYDVAHRRVETADAMRAAFEKEEWDIIVSDHRMPRFDVLGALKLRGQYAPDVPFIVVSGGIGEEAAVEAMRGGADDYVMKDKLARFLPVVQRELAGAIGRRARRRVETELEESVLLTGMILQSALDCIVIADHEGRLIEFNPAAEATFGFSRNEVLGKPMSGLIIPPRWREAHDRAFAAYLATGMGRMLGRRLELDALRSDGTEFPIELTLAIVRHAPKPVFAAFIRDISARRRAEESLRRFRVAMDNSADMFLLIDRKTMRYVDFNPAVCRLLGYTSEELLSMGPQDVLPLSREQLERSYDELIANPSMRGGMESHYICKDGSHLPFESTRHVLRSGDTWIIAAISRDIRERRAADTKIRQLNRVYAVLSGINAAIVRIHDKDELYRETCRIAIAEGGFNVARVVELDEDRRIRIAAVIEDDEAAFEQLVEEYNADPAGHDSLIARAIRTGKAVVSNDVASDPRVHLRTFLRRSGSYALAVLPLSVRGRPAGLIILRSKEPGMFDVEEMKLLTELAGDVSFALEHIENEKKLDYLALYDSLTGLANRTLFVERLTQAIHAAGQAGSKLAVGICDVERLRTVNETLGRGGGDSLLKQLAERHVRAAGRIETGRLSADHFVTMAPVKGRSEAARIAQVITMKCFAEPFFVEGHELRVSAKAGIAMFPADGMDAETLLKHAEAALRKGKRTGEPHTFFSRGMLEDTAGALTLENKLRQALENDEFVLHYQPKVDGATRRIAGVEALIRWDSPELGLVPPMQFIPLMEETGIILRVGAWALSTAVADHRRWVEMKLAAPRVAVNVSAIQLRRQDFLDTLESALARGAAPMGLDLELTESLVMEDVESSILKLNEARKLGISLAIDDFGTGYSSLAYLARLPVQTLKIDRSFVITMLEDPDTMALVQMIISLAHSLRLKVVAEGVDDEAQAKVLQLLRCDEMQGFLFSQPLPFGEMTALLVREGKL